MEMRNETSYLKAESAPRYLLIGNGRVARHFAHYLSLENLNHRVWSRSGDPNKNLESLVQGCTHVLLLISDSSIESFYLENPVLKTKSVVHFSGSLASKLVPGAHPLMTFSNQIYDLDIYRRIPFVIDAGFAGRDLLPGLTNPFAPLDPQHKALYHALCVLGGNYTTILWEKAFSGFQEKLGLPKSVLIPYLHQITQNLISAASGESVLTGPLARGDQAVIDRHLFALKDDPFSHVYSAFVTAYRASQDKGLQI